MTDLSITEAEAMFTEKQQQLPNLTYKDAREISIKKYKMFLKSLNPHEDTIFLHIEAMKFRTYTPGRFICNCPLCEYFLVGYMENGSMHDPLQCDKCPLYWKDAKHEPFNNYRPTRSFECSRSYWKMVYWKNEAFRNRNPNKKEKRLMIYWLKKLITELKNTPEDII